MSAERWGTVAAVLAAASAACLAYAFVASGLHHLTAARARRWRQQRAVDRAWGLHASISPVPRRPTWRR